MVARQQQEQGQDRDRSLRGVAARLSPGYPMAKTSAKLHLKLSLKTEPQRQQG